VGRQGIQTHRRERWFVPYVHGSLGTPRIACPSCLRSLVNGSPTCFHPHAPSTGMREKDIWLSIAVPVPLLAKVALTILGLRLPKPHVRESESSSYVCAFFRLQVSACRAFFTLTSVCVFVWRHFVQIIPSIMFGYIHPNYIPTTPHQSLQPMTVRMTWSKFSASLTPLLPCNSSPIDIFGFMCFQVLCLSPNKGGAYQLFVNRRRVRLIRH